MLVLPGRGTLLALINLFQPNEHGPSRDTSKDSDYMFATTEPVPGEKLKIGSFVGKMMSKFVDICDEVSKLRLCITPYCS